MTALVVAPSRREAAVCGRGAAVCGSGAAAAESVSAQLERTGADLLVVAGFCGGLDPSLPPGSLVLGRRVLTDGQPTLTPDPARLAAARRRLRAARLGFVTADILTLEKPAGRREQKRDLWNTYGAAGADMETYALVKAAAERGTGWLVLRAVLDTAGQSLPRDLLDWQSEAYERQIVRRAARRPAEWPAYARLALGMRRALQALARGVPLVVAAGSSTLPLASPGGGSLLASSE